MPSFPVMIPQALSGVPAVSSIPFLLKVNDVKGSYTIPYIQSADTLTLTMDFSKPLAAKAELVLLQEGAPLVAPLVVDVGNPSAKWGALRPGEYSLKVVGRDASGVVVTETQYTRIGIGAVLAALGDSITEGYHSQGFWRDELDLKASHFPEEVVSKDGRNYPQFSPTTAKHRPDVNCFTSWMPRLNDLLAEKWKRPVFIANEGIGGSTTAGYLDMMKTDAGWQERMRLLKPQLWLIHLGVNDERALIPATTVAANLEAIIELLIRDYGASASRIFVAKPCFDYWPGAFEYLTAYSTEIAWMAARGVGKGPDFFSAYSRDKETYYGDDPVHPNVRGMDMMAALWADALPVMM